MANFTTVNSGGVEIISQYGSSSVTRLISVGSAQVFSGGSALWTNISAGSTETVLSAGAADGARVYNGGSLAVSNGGIAYYAYLSSGGIETMLNSGYSFNTTAFCGGTETVFSGGYDGGPTVSSGGQETVSSDGNVINTAINNGGSLTVSSGGIANGVDINSGGTEILNAGATTTGAITFSGGNASLVISGTSLPTNTISGFDAGSLTDLTLLASLPYSASDSVTLGAGNVLTMMLNGSAYTLDFNSTENFSGHAFSAVNSNGDVAIVDPVVSNGGVASTKGVPALQDLWGTKSFAAIKLGLAVAYNATSESWAAVSSVYVGGMESADLSGSSHHHPSFPGINPSRTSIEDGLQSDHYAQFNIKQP